MCSPKTLLTQLSMWPGLELLESMLVQSAANAGTSLSTVLNVQLPFPLMVLCTWAVRAKLKILTVSAILKGTVTTSTKERYAWDSGLEIVPDMETATPKQVGIQCPGSSLKKFLQLRLRTCAKPSVPHKCINRL